MNRALVVLLVAATAGLVSAAPAVAETGPAPEGTQNAGSSHQEASHQEALQREVDAVVDSGAMGVLAEVTTPDGRRVARAGVADVDTGQPVPLDAEFRIGSSTKTFVATVVLQLVDEGRLSLDDTVERWLPGVVVGNGNDGAQITVRQLLQHTSGLYNYTEDIPALASTAAFEANRFRTYTPEELVALAMAHPPNFAPGTDWSYSNTNFVLAGMIIHSVTGRSWAEEVNDRIICRLGLGHTRTPGSFPFILGPHAQGYSNLGAGETIDVTAFNPSAADAAGSMTSTTDDLSRFYKALVGGELLSPARLADMEATVPAPDFGPGVGYGLGLAWAPLSCGGGYFGHPGDVPGYHVWDGVTPDAQRVVALSYTGDGGEDTEQVVATFADQELCGAS